MSLSWLCTVIYNKFKKISRCISPLFELLPHTIYKWNNLNNCANNDKGYDRENLHMHNTKTFINNSQVAVVSSKGSII